MEALTNQHVNYKKQFDMHMNTTKFAHNQRIYEKCREVPKLAHQQDNNHIQTKATQIIEQGRLLG